MTNGTTRRDFLLASAALPLNDGFEACTWYRDHWTVDRNITQTASGVGQDLELLKAITRRTTEEIGKLAQ